MKRRNPPSRERTDEDLQHCSRLLLCLVAGDIFRCPLSPQKLNEAAESLKGPQKDAHTIPELRLLYLQKKKEVGFL